MAQSQAQSLSVAEMLQLKAFFAKNTVETIRAKGNPKYMDRINKLSPENIHNFMTGIQITKKVAESADDAEWQSFLTTGAMPPVKLTEEEMELVRGGAVGAGTALVGAGITIGAGVSALVVIVDSYW